MLPDMLLERFDWDGVRAKNNHFEILGANNIDDSEEDKRINTYLRISDENTGCDAVKHEILLCRDTVHGRHV